MIRRRLRSSVPVAVAVTLALAAACGDDEPDESTTTTAPSSTETTGDAMDPEPPSRGSLEEVALEVQEVASLDSPIALTARPGSDDLYVAEKRGTVRRIQVTTQGRSDALRYRLSSTPVLDLSEEVIDEGERGLLGLAFSSDGRNLYVNYTAQPDGRTVVSEYELGDRSSVSAQSGRVLLEVDQPFANHNGGHVALGPDGYLYVGLGDGGDAGDPDDRGQDPHDLLGSVLRIDPDAGSEDGEPYGIPAGNPFADGGEGAPEVWLYGVRNPWRFSFDRSTGDLWVADVGQDQREEITLLPSRDGFDAGRGANLGWNLMEGSGEREGPNPEGGVLPVHEYSHDEGCSITGGFVYRGADIPALVGAYLFADFCEPGLRAIRVESSSVVDERTWAEMIPSGTQSFGEDGAGELFILLREGPVLKLVPSPDPSTGDDG